MKKTVLSIVLLMSTLCTMDAATIHWITFVDTTDPGVGAIDQNTRSILYNRWIHVVSAALAPKGYDAKMYDYDGLNTTPQNCKAIVQQLKCSSEDIIVFYYIGHGGRSIFDASKYPQMCLAQHDVNLFVPLEWVHNQLKSKNARLALTIGMCCNSADVRITPKIAPTFGINRGNTYLEASTISNIQKMFLQTKGDLIISSSSAYESSSAIQDRNWNLIDTDLGYTDYFSYMIIKLLDKVAEQGGENMLLKYFDRVCGAVVQWSEQDGHKQTPQYDSNLHAAELPANTTPRPQPKPQSQERSAKDVIEKNLSYIIDKNVDMFRRMAVMKSFQAFFSPNAVVRVVSQDADVVVGKERPSQFLSRIVSNRILLDVSLYGFKLDGNGKIAEMKVQEYYKK